jgi:hypothetical protein
MTRGNCLFRHSCAKETKRWVEVEAGSGLRLLLAKAANETQAVAIGNQTGGRVHASKELSGDESQRRGTAP